MKAATKEQGKAKEWYDISIHAAREGGDGLAPVFINQPKAFQSTPPVKAATMICKLGNLLIIISIHAAREGGDNNFRFRAVRQHDFNPRRP